MANTHHVFDFLAATGPASRVPVCVLFGGEPFLKRLALHELRRRVVGEETPIAEFEGPVAEWRDVVDELATVSLFGGGGPRVAVVQDADKFVTKFRDKLEDFVAKPKPTGLLVLDVETWASNTKLYKAVDQAGLQIECRPPEIARGKNKVLDEGRLAKWLSQWSQTQHEAALPADAAKVLLELVGPEFGLLDQELAKLALFAGRGGAITPVMVQDVVGGWRTKTTWELIDAAADGDTGEALRQLDRLLQAGQEPIALFGQIAWSLRRFTVATRIFQDAERDQRRVPLAAALEQAGFRKWPPQELQKAERQLIQLGRDRAGRLTRWLLDADLSLKGSHSSPARARFVLEHLFAKLSKELGPRRAKS